MNQYKEIAIKIHGKEAPQEKLAETEMLMRNNPPAFNFFTSLFSLPEESRMRVMRQIIEKSKSKEVTVK